MGMVNVNTDWLTVCAGDPPSNQTEQSPMAEVEPSANASIIYHSPVKKDFSNGVEPSTDVPFCALYSLGMQQGEGVGLCTKNPKRNPPP